MIIGYIILILTGAFCVGVSIWEHKKCKQKDYETESYNQALQAEKTVLEERTSKLRAENDQLVLSNKLYLEESQSLSKQQDQLKQMVNELHRQSDSLKVQTKIQQGELNVLKQEYDLVSAQKDAISGMIDDLSRNQKEMARDSFTVYCDALELEYNKAEAEHDAQLELLDSIYDKRRDELTEQENNLLQEKRDDIKELEELFYKTQMMLSSAFANKQSTLELEFRAAEAELANIRATRAAALQAQLREQEIKEQATFYTLQINEADKRDIAYLQSIEMNLREARPLRMLIWSTFYRDKLNDLASRVGANGACGIYKITHIDSGISYIGQAKDIKARWSDHIKCSLGIDTPVTSQLYAFTRDKGIDNFTFEILEKCKQEALNEKEKFYISLYQTYDYGLNKTHGNK